MIPPFEVFYDTHRDEVFRYLASRLGRERAEDAFQETFLRALRAYDRLEHADHLRAWVLTIASRIAIDDVRRRKPTEELTVDIWHEDARPAFEELAPFTDNLPPKERAAVVLRYGYDLDYAEIAATLGSNEQAARQAASAGVRRLRKERS
ncbi:MAG: sigma-70 family RNA polymerase sigma factor [Actinomycetota bacterium]